MRKRQHQSAATARDGKTDGIQPCQRQEDVVTLQRAHAEALTNELVTIMQQLDMAILITDREHRILRANPMLARLLCQPLRSLHGKRITDITGNDTTDQMRETVWRTGTTLRNRTLPYPFSQPEKATPSFWDITIKPIKNAQGEIVEMLTTATDVTEHIQTEQQLRYERARWQAILTALPVPILFVDAQGIVQWVNNTAKAIWQRDFTGLTWNDATLTHSELDPNTQQPFPPEKRPLARAWRGQNVRDVEVLIARADGSTVPLRIQAVPIRLGKEVGGAVSVGEDLTHIKQTDRMKDAFLAAVSHDLRSPLAAIIGWAQLVASSTPDDPIIQEAMGAILRSTATQQVLINDLLDVSALAAGALRIQRKRQDLRPIITAFVEDMIPTAQAQQKILRMRVPTAAVEATVDAMRLRQILGNLLSNALKFTPEGGEITVTLAQTGTQAILRVHDTGRGISTGVLPHIFEPFYQVTSGKPRTGIGIGLSIVKALVELHHGTIRVESPGEGQGSTFIVTLPCTAGAKQ